MPRNATPEIGRSPGSQDGFLTEGLELVEFVIDIKVSDSSVPFLPKRIAEAFHFNKPSGCAPFPGTCSKLPVETCILLGDFDLHTSSASWPSASFLKHAVCSGVGGVRHTIGVTGLLAPGLSSPGLRSFH